MAFYTQSNNTIGAGLMVSMLVAPLFGCFHVSPSMPGHNSLHQVDRKTRNKSIDVVTGLFIGQEGMRLLNRFALPF